MSGSQNIAHGLSVSAV
uniref:Uncharacterized protein n=1 Tax=Anguilla anguilla TaxID=7936 RepID=A0A0E9XBJ4_ANGAN